MKLLCSVLFSIFFIHLSYAAEGIWESHFFQKASNFVPDHHYYPFEKMKEIFYQKIEGENVCKYTEKDFEMLTFELSQLERLIFGEARKERFLLVTAGGPCAGKSMLLESLIEGKNYAYIDPDRTCLFNMNCYLEDKKENNLGPLKAYLYWREASTFFSNIFFAHALNNGYAIAFGTTLTPPDSIIALIMSGVKGYEYQSKLIHLTAPDSVRFASEKLRREQGLVQCTDEDLLQKGRWFFHRLDAYLKNFDSIDFYYREKRDDPSIFIATWENKEWTIENYKFIPDIQFYHNRSKNSIHYWDETLRANR